MKKLVHGFDKKFENAFYDIKTRSLKRRKIGIFPKGVVFLKNLKFFNVVFEAK